MRLLSGAQASFTFRPGPFIPVRLDPRFIAYPHRPLQRSANRASFFFHAPMIALFRRVSRGESVTKVCSVLRPAIPGGAGIESTPGPLAAGNPVAGTELRLAGLALVIDRGVRGDRCIRLDVMTHTATESVAPRATLGAGPIAGGLLHTD